jgi:hypothetical protein
MNNPKYFIIGIFLLITACNKSEFDDLSGDEALTGTVLIADTLNGSIKYSVLKNSPVFLANLADSTGYLYSVTTNAQGNYSFVGIDPEKDYKVYASTDTGVVKYYGVNKYHRNILPVRQSDSLKLYPSSNDQNGIHLIVRTAEGAKLANATSWVFTSSSFFDAGIADGKIFDMTTNLYGVSNKFNIPKGTYYLRVKTEVGNLKLQGQETIDVLATGIKTVTIKLAPYSPNNNGLEIKVLDVFATPVNSANVYGYRSKAIFQLDSLQTNSIFSLSSNASGLASIYNIDPATYYLRIVKIIGKDTLSTEESVIVNSMGTTMNTVVLR